MKYFYPAIKWHLQIIAMMIIILAVDCVPAIAQSKNNFGFESVAYTDYTTTNTINTSISSKSMMWTFGGYRFTIQLPLDVNTYTYYKNQTKKTAPINFAKEDHGHPYLLHVAEKLDEDAKVLGYRDFQMVAYLTAFVQQNIIYTQDPYNNGWDYPKFPIETLFEKKGDCEDSAVLLAVLLKVFGFDAILVNLPGHMAVAVECKNCGAGYSYNNKMFAYIETTSSSPIGRMPEMYRNTNATLQEINGLPRYYRSSTKVPSYVTTIDTPIPNSTINECGCPKSERTKRITIAGKSYSIRNNESYTIQTHGVTVTISN